LKKFFVALTILLCMAGNVNAAQFTAEQGEKMLSITLQNSDAPLKLDIATFQKNFDAFITQFVNETNAGDDAEAFRQSFLIGKPRLGSVDGRTIFLRNFMDMAAILGTVDADGKIETINFFYPQIADQNDAMTYMLILQSFAKGISPDLDAQALIDEANKNPDGTFVKGNVKFTFKTLDNLNMVSAAAN